MAKKDDVQDQQEQEAVTQASSPAEVQDKPHEGLTREKCIERGLDPSCYGFEPVSE